ncbi:hypothetical protein E4U24_007768 [Claviceps purpurea]|nr:hypothetical protein E4U24_007768 [Claviceps purpurea]KAG6267379.1 hypothetical protein E4U49_008168 [Claviceps purpurea]
MCKLDAVPAKFGFTIQKRRGPDCGKTTCKHSAQYKPPSKAAKAAPKRAKRAQKPGGHDFGGMSVLLLGDFAQLPPVFDKPFKKTTSARADKAHAQVMYEKFNGSVFLKQVVRQAGDSQKPFRDALAALRDGNPTPEHFHLLCTRIQNRLPPSDVIGFKDALRIYRTNAQVNSYNREHLEKIQKPIINIACDSTGRGSNKAASRDAGNLQQQLSLCVGAKVMLTENLWTAQAPTSREWSRLFVLKGEGSFLERGGSSSSGEEEAYSYHRFLESRAT